MSPRLLPGMVLAFEAMALGAALLLVADFRAHRASEQLGGVNIWGYRGPVMRQKAGNETRIAVVGGDLAFGWGVAASETLAPGLRLLASVALDRPGNAARRVTAVNLGAMGLPPRRYASRVDHYRYLRPDVVCIYVDLPSSAADSGWAVLPQENSLIFAATGYAPMLPLVLVDKGAAVQSTLMAQTGRLLSNADAAMYRALWKTARPVTADGEADAIADATRAALTVARGVVVIVPPYANDGIDTGRHMDVIARVGTVFHDDRRVRMVDLGDVGELADPGLKLDGVNFSAGGHARVAEVVAPAVLELVP
jgi:hypothetical protein